MTHMILHFHNLAEGREAEYDAYLRSIPELIGDSLVLGQRYTLSDVQFQAPTAASQPYSGLTLFEFEPAGGDTERLAEAIRGGPSRAGLFASELSQRYDIKTNRMLSHRRPPADAPEHLMIVMANFIPEMEKEWGQWYDSVHGVEILEIEDLDAYSRGVLLKEQIDPAAEQPNNGLILHHYRTHDFAGNVAEFQARGMGTSKSGVHWTGRSPAALFNRTTHGFDAVGPQLTSK